jgi:hypothetical protein
VKGVTRPAAAAGLPTLPIDEADPVPEQIETADAAPTINQSPPQQLAEVTPLERPIVPEPSREESSGIAPVAAVIVASEAPTVVPVDAETEPMLEVVAPLDSKAPLPQFSSPDQLGMNLDHDTMKPEPVSSTGVADSRRLVDGQKADNSPKPKRTARSSASNGKNSGKQKDPPSSS